MSYDDYILDGRLHKCVCGAPWYDSDGAPCHYICDDCGKMFSEEDFTENGKCFDCDKKNV